MAPAPTPIAILIGTVWPESESSAAGVRTALWTERLQAWGYTVHYGTTARDHPARARLEARGVHTRTLELNDSTFDAWIRELSPTLVLFDRFVIEEQFGWRVMENAPHCLRLLDMQDFHALRRVRQEQLKEQLKAQLENLRDEPRPTPALHAAVSPEELPWISVRTELLRELASIYRSDLTWVISEAEEGMLRNFFKVPATRLKVSGFAYAAHDVPRGDRKDFVMLGNFRHPPNADAIRVAHQLWPQIRAAAASSAAHAPPELHIYGAYPLKELVALDDPKSGFRVLGPCDDATETLARYRVQLAPLRFGAGLKGKICDSFAAGTPVITTPMGSEGIFTPHVPHAPDAAHAPHTQKIPVAATDEEFISLAVRAYSDADFWQTLQTSGTQILRTRFNRQTIDAQAKTALETALRECEARRNNDWVGAMVSQETLLSKKYLSRWIEAKNATK